LRPHLSALLLLQAPAGQPPDVAAQLLQICDVTVRLQRICDSIMKKAADGADG